MKFEYPDWPPETTYKGTARGPALSEIQRTAASCKECSRPELEHSNSSPDLSKHLVSYLWTHIWKFQFLLSNFLLSSTVEQLQT